MKWKDPTRIPTPQVLTILADISQSEWTLAASQINNQSWEENMIIHQAAVINETKVLYYV